MNKPNVLSRCLFALGGFFGILFWISLNLDAGMSGVGTPGPIHGYLIAPVFLLLLSAAAFWLGTLVENRSKHDDRGEDTSRPAALRSAEKVDPVSGWAPFGKLRGQVAIGRLLELSDGALAIHLGTFVECLLISEFTRCRLEDKVDSEIILYCVTDTYCFKASREERLALFRNLKPEAVESHYKMHDSVQVGFLNHADCAFYQLLASALGTPLYDIPLGRSVLRGMDRPVQELCRLPGIDIAIALGIVILMPRLRFPVLEARAETETWARSDGEPMLRKFGFSDTERQRLLDTAIELWHANGELGERTKEVRHCAIDQLTRRSRSRAPGEPEFE